MCSSDLGYRWAHNLGAVDAPEPQRFVGYYREAAGESAAVLATAAASVSAPPPAPPEPEPAPATDAPAESPAP